MTEPLPNLVLRNLPGVGRVEALLARAKLRPNYKWCDEWDEAERLADAVGRRLFGLTLADTKWTPEDIEDGWEDEFDWECHFLQWSEPDARGRSYGTEHDLSELGWDVTDAQGSQLLSAELFYRQLVCVSMNIAGHEAGTERTEAELKSDAEEWAATFLAGPRHRRIG